MRKKLNEDVANSKIKLKKGSVSYFKAVVRTVMTFQKIANDAVKNRLDKREA